MRHSLVCNILTDTRLHNHRAPIYRTAMSVIAMVCMLLPLPLLLLSPLLMTRTNDDERRRPYYYKIFALLHRMNKSGSSVIRFALIFWCVCALCCIYKLHKSDLSSSLSLSFCFLIFFVCWFSSALTHCIHVQWILHYIQLRLVCIFFFCFAFDKHSTFCLSSIRVNRIT